MFVGFGLFERLTEEWEFLEVFPNAIVHALAAASIHKSKAGGIDAQWKAATPLTWPRCASGRHSAGKCRLRAAARPPGRLPRGVGGVAGGRAAARRRHLPALCL